MPQPSLSPSSIFCSSSGHTLNFSYGKGPEVPRTYLLEFMFSWGSSLHSFNSIHWSHLAQALGHALSHHHQDCLSPASVHSSSLNLFVYMFPQETFFKPLKLNKVPFLCAFYIYKDIWRAAEKERGHVFLPPDFEVKDKILFRHSIWFKAWVIWEDK